MKKMMVCLGLLLGIIGAQGQTFSRYESTDGNFMRKSRANVKATTKAQGGVLLSVEKGASGTTFKAWGTCFNELGWDALTLLSDQEQTDLMRRLFAPDGDLRFTHGRVSMNANDYARGWYCCDSVAGDFSLRYFNINRDKTTLIPYIKMAQKANPALTCWMSPWSPPHWMKINNDYPVRSSQYSSMDPRKDAMLLEGADAENKNVFPQRLSVQNYLIQDPRYLQTYANMFCRFIDLYRQEGITIDMVMYQNEAWSYTPYPGCAWTADGIILFNTKYLAPTLQKHHPEVDLYLGTINTNRREVVDKIVGDDEMQHHIKGVGFQWEGGQRLPEIHQRYPQLNYICSESECGHGTFDWRAAEHTFHLINHYLGNGCNEYCCWNAILADGGVSPWGWKQNALVQVDSKTRQMRLCPEYYAYMHYSHFIDKGAQIVAYKETGDDRCPLLVAVSPAGKRIIVAGNLGDQNQTKTLRVGKKYVNIELKAHSFCTLVEK